MQNSPLVPPPGDFPALTQSELAYYRAQAEAVNPPSLTIVKRFLITLRLNTKHSPTKTEATKKTRVTKPKPDESQVDFF